MRALEKHFELPVRKKGNGLKPCPTQELHVPCQLYTDSEFAFASAITSMRPASVACRIMPVGLSRLSWLMQSYPKRAHPCVQFSPSPAQNHLSWLTGGDGGGGDGGGESCCAFTALGNASAMRTGTSHSLVCITLASLSCFASCTRTLLSTAVYTLYLSASNNLGAFFIHHASSS